MTAALTIHFRNTFGLGGSVAVQHLFEDAASAKVVQDHLFAAAKAYHDRANDREKMVSFSHLCGEASVDVSEIMALSFMDPLGPKRAAYEAWERGMNEVRAAGEAAGKVAASAIEAASADETRLRGSAEGESATGEAGAAQ